MRQAITFLTLATMLTVACSRPEVEALRKNPPTIAVSFSASEVSGGVAVEQEYAAALRARLANRVEVVPETVPPPADAARLEVKVTRRAGHKGPSPAAVGVATGVAVGMISAATGHRGAFFDGLYWGLWAGHDAAWHERGSRRREWVVPPNQVEGEVTLVVPGRTAYVTHFEVDPEEVLDAMDPLRPSEQEDPQRVREEEAKAFARVVVSQLTELYQWPVAREPRWYRVPSAGAEGEPKSPMPGEGEVRKPVAVPATDPK